MTCSVLRLAFLQRQGTGTRIAQPSAMASLGRSFIELRPAVRSGCGKICRDHLPAGPGLGLDDDPIVVAAG